MMDAKTFGADVSLSSEPYRAEKVEIARHVTLEHFAEAKTQAFFADLAKAARSPGAGDIYRQFVSNLLLRAQEANLYTPETT
jgi:hypothetical protein